jgi:small multidrug resistance pump
MTTSANERPASRVRASVLLAVAIAVEVCASLSLSAAQQQPAFFVVVVFGYAGSLALLGLVLAAGMPVGVAYGVWGACGVMLTAVLAHLLFGDPLTPVMLGGIVLVIIGVLLIEIGLQRARERRQRSDAKVAE